MIPSCASSCDMTCFRSPEFGRERYAEVFDGTIGSKEDASYARGQVTYTTPVRRMRWVPW